MVAKKPLFGGTIEGRIYFNEDYINKILTLIGEQKHNLLNFESENLLDILIRHQERVIQVDVDMIFLNTLKDYFTTNFKLTHSFEIKDVITQILKNH